MRTVEEIEAGIKKVNTAKRNAERKRARRVERLTELHKELKNAPAEAGTSDADA